MTRRVATLGFATLALSVGAPVAAAPAPGTGAARPDDRPVGGYWAPGERPRPEPPDGHWNIVVGSILLPLGVLGTAGAAAGAYVTDPRRCERYLDLDRDSCRGYYAFSLVRIAYSGLMAVTGAVLLAQGLHHRKAHQAWSAGRNFSLAPSWSPGGPALVLHLVF